MDKPVDLEAPSNCGKRLLPAVLDDVASTDPQRTFASVPKSTNIADGFEDVSYHTFANAVNRCAWWLKQELGEESEPRVVLYAGPLDLRYIIIILAAAKAGHIAFFSSHRNSLEAHLSLIERSGCSVVAYPENPPAFVNQILEAKPLKGLDMPSIDYFMDEDVVEPMPLRLEWEDAKDKPFCILHTSGSTGIPKPVFVTYGTFACNDAHQLIPSYGGKPTLVNFLKGKRFFLALPLFHAACLTFILGFNIFAGVICVLPPPAPLSADVVNQVFLHGKLDGALLAPSLIVDCYNNNEYCANMIRKVNFLTYVGGALPEEVGDPLSKQTKLMTLMGSCETALHPLEMNEDPADWQYLTISPFLGHTFRSEKDGLYDLVVERQPNLALFQGVFSTFPKKQEFAMGDLFAPHPSRPESWVFRARADDIIAFTTAEKLNPITMESVIAANPHIKAAVIGGAGQFQASLLVEPKVYPENAEEKDLLIRNIWPSVLQANRDCPAHGRIMKGFVFFTKPDKPLPIAGKGTIQRHAALKLYAEEFKELYDRMKPSIVPAEDKAKKVTETATVAVDLANAMSGSTVNDTASVQHAASSLQESLDAFIAASIEKHLEAALARLLPKYLGAIPPKQQDGLLTPPENSPSEPVPQQQQHSPPKDIPPTVLRKLIYDNLSENLSVENMSDEDDMFSYGMDSLQVPDLLSVINSYLIRSKPGVELIDLKTVYDNPSVGRLLQVCS